MSLELCGRVINYDPSKHDPSEQGPGFVTVSVALPGTGHPIQTSTISAEGRWAIKLVPGAPLQVAATVPGSPAASMRIAEPLPCSREVYEIELGSGPATVIAGTISNVLAASTIPIWRCRARWPGSGPGSALRS